MATDQTAAADDLEYHVTFPVPTPGDDPDGEFNTLKNMLQTNETAVLLIGWMGCEDKHLAKYSQIYENIGCTTVRYSTKFVDVAPAKNKSAEVARKLLEVLVEMNLCDNPVLFHIFSNGGCRLYNAMRDQLQEDSTFEDIEKLGVVYDSAPGNPSVSQAAYATFPRHRTDIWTSIMRMGLYTVSAVAFGIGSFLKLFGLQILPTMYDEMIYRQDGCPELYLFSKADELVSSSDVENVIQRRQMQGVDITFQCWDDSPHVRHMTTHREGYMNQCYDFLKKCLHIANSEDTE